MKTEVLKKHHYWIVAGVSLLLVLITFLLMTSGVSGAIESKQAEIKKADTETNVTPPGRGALAEIERQKKILEAKKDELWQRNWENQKRFYTWPSTRDRLFDAYNTLKFGSDLPDYTDYRAQTLQRVDVYKALYEKMAEAVAPTRFQGGWPAALGERFIASWGDKKPEPRQLWLAMEDVWVLRAMLDPIRVVNESAARFVEIPGGNARKKSFQNLTWEIELELVDQPPNTILRGKLKNRTPQMQPLGANSTMVLKVWLDPNKDISPVEFRIEGEYVAGNSEYPPPAQPPQPQLPLPQLIIPPGITVTELAAVEQVLDERTVPIRQVQRVSLSTLSAKETVQGKTRETLLPPRFWPDEAPAADPSMSSNAPAVPGSVAAAPAMGMRTELPAAGGMGFPGMAGSGGTGASMNKKLEEAVDAQRRRYLEVTDQLRRMPVAISLICDQRFMQDVMVAYANSPLRLQIVQYTWQRYRGSLESSTPREGGPASSPGETAAASPSGRSEIAAGGGLMRRGMTTETPAAPAMVAEGLRGGRGFPSPRGGDTAPPPMSSEGDVEGVRGLGMRPGFIPGLAGGSLASVSEGQANSGLVELTIYGIVTLYEKFDRKPEPATGAAPDPSNPAPGGDSPKPAETPMTGQPTAGTTEPKKN